MRLNNQQQWELRNIEYQWALYSFELAEWAFDHDKGQLAQRHMIDMYVHLMDMADAVWRPEQTKKQKQQQKLWQERGLLERTKANLNSCCTNTIVSSYLQINILQDAYYVLQELIRQNQEKMRNIK